jgi:O-antigen/teichoic acid export membrane protein
MGVFVMANSLSKEMGKLVIGGRMTVDWYAIYANCASPLPFDVISSSFLVVMIPVLTRLLAERRFDRALLMFRHYVTIGYLTTVAVAAGALLVAPEAVRFLYGETYVPGVAVFQLNLVATMFQFANLSLVLSASGRTKVLMLVSICSLAINAVLAPASFDLLGFVGPAVATCLVSLLTTVSLFLLSLRVLNGKVRDVLEPRRVLHFVVVSAVLFVVVGALRLVLVSVGVNYVAVLTMCGGLYVALSVWMFRRELKDAISLLNQAEWSMA